MASCSSCRTAKPTPLHRVALVAALASLAAAVLVAWQPSGQLPAGVVESTPPAPTVALLGQAT